MRWGREGEGRSDASLGEADVGGDVGDEDVDGVHGGEDDVLEDDDDGESLGHRALAPVQLLEEFLAEVGREAHEEPVAYHPAEVHKADDVEPHSFNQRPIVKQARKELAVDPCQRI